MHKSSAKELEVRLNLVNTLSYFTFTEKAPDSKIEPVEPTYVSKLKDNFLDSLSGVIEFLGNLLIIVVAALPVLVLLGLMLLIVYFVSKKFLKLKIKKPEKKSDNTENECPAVNSFNCPMSGSIRVIRRC